MARRRSSAALAALLALLGCLHASAAANRGEAFIGYREKNEIKCKNFYDDCDARASKSQCLTDPFAMRKFCPVSCVVEPCGFQGTVRRVHQGHATKDGTAQYRAHFEGDGDGGVSTLQQARQSRAWNSAAGQQQGQQQQEMGPTTVSTAPGHFRDIFVDDPNSTLALSSLGLGTYLGEGKQQRPHTHTPLPLQRPPCCPHACRGWQPCVQPNP
jgi:hypothetical protein